MRRVSMVAVVGLLAVAGAARAAGPTSNYSYKYYYGMTSQHDHILLVVLGTQLTSFEYNGHYACASPANYAKTPPGVMTEDIAQNVAIQKGVFSGTYKNPSTRHDFTKYTGTFKGGNVSGSFSLTFSGGPKIVCKTPKQVTYTAKHEPLHGKTWYG